MWDIGADGYARGEGVAAVVLKTLSQAIADGDTIECIIRESGVNQDGKTPGITMPSPTAQQALIEQVYRDAGLDIKNPKDRCQYFEAHGKQSKGEPPAYMYLRHLLTCTPLAIKARAHQQVSIILSRRFACLKRLLTFLATVCR